MIEGGFEGDILLNDEPTLDKIPGHYSSALRDVSKRWPGGIVPYTFVSKYNDVERTFIAGAIEHIQNNTCIRFVEKNSSHGDYIGFMKLKKGCASLVGRLGGPQAVYLDNNRCMKMGTIAHELIHVLGFYHEQSRNDRDDYVFIIYDNIKKTEAAYRQFRKHNLSHITHLDTPYDYGSLMHYSRYVGSRNKKPTIVPWQPGVEIGQRNGMSQNDILKLNRYYDCYGYPGVGAGTDKCRDGRSDCIKYIRLNRCDEVMTTCKRTCGRCKGDANQRLAPSPKRKQYTLRTSSPKDNGKVKQAPNMSSSCRDTDWSHCVGLQQRNQCKYVWRFCKRTCGRCETS